MSETVEERGVIPKLRFPGFTEPWKRVQISSTLTILKGRGISKAEIAHNGILPCIRYGELYTRYGNLIDDVSSRTNVPATELLLSVAGDVIIPSSGETKEDIATAACVLSSGVALGGDLSVLRGEPDGRWLSYYVNGRLKAAFAKVAQGDSVVHLYPDQIGRVVFAVPCKTEQQSIGQCLQSLDDVIAAETRKLDALKRRKKGLLQQLFPAEGETAPRLRFKVFRESGEWKEESLSDLGALIQGLTYNPSDVRDCGLLVLRSSNIKSGKIALDDCVYVDPHVKGANLSKPNDILICVRNGSAALIGKNALLPTGLPLCTHGAFMSVYRSPSANFVYQLFQTLEYQRQVAADLGATINSINGSQFLKYKFFVPALSEQQRVAEFLHSVDERTEAVAKKLESLKKHKAALMQQLFPSLEELDAPTA